MRPYSSPQVKFELLPSQVSSVLTIRVDKKWEISQPDNFKPPYNCKDFFLKFQTHQYPSHSKNRTRANI